MPIEGPLKELGIHDVFHLLDLGSETGELTVVSRLRRNRGTIYFEDGAVVHAAIGSNPHPLGEVLLRAGKIADADLQRARGMQHRGDGRRLGEILVDIGTLTRDDLERYVRQQIAEVVFEIMSWREGYFTFTEGPLEQAPGEATVRLPGSALLLEAARRIDEWSRIAARIPHLGLVPTLTPAEGAETGRLELLPVEWEILAATDGVRDLREISETVRRSEFDVARAVFGLASAGVLVLGERTPADALDEPSGGTLEGLIAQIDQALEDDDLESAELWAEHARAKFPDDAAVAIVHGRLALRRGDAMAAEHEFRKALRLDPLMAPAHLLLGDALARQGRFGEATEWWERWLTVSSHADEESSDTVRVREAIRAAHTLSTFLGPHR
jgi:tetratricopeptide (TPR) repeat protein